MTIAPESFDDALNIPTPALKSPSAMDSSHYQQEYTRDRLAGRWSEYAPEGPRAAAEGGFITDRMRDNGVRRLLDMACGDGFHSLQLAKLGVQVKSVDGSSDMLDAAEQNAQARGLPFDRLCVDWRDPGFVEAVGTGYDAVLCLGNSFTFLEVHDRTHVLKHIYEVTRPGGMVIIDHRNYDALLDNPGFAFSSPMHYQPGMSRCVEANERFTRFRITFADGTWDDTVMFPVRLEPFRQSLFDAGFTDVRTHGDMEPVFHASEVSYFTHFFRRPLAE